MCDGMLACETPLLGTRSHALFAVALQLLLFLSSLPAGQASVSAAAVEYIQGATLSKPD